MDGKISKRYFIGKSKPGEWASVYTYRPQSPLIRKKRGEIFASISLVGPEEFSMATAGNLLLDHFHENYFENREDKTLICLEKAVLETGKFLQKLLENDKIADVGIDFDLIASVVIEDLVYIVNLGQGIFYVYRDGELIKIDEDLKDPTGEGLIKTGSFIAKKNDIYLTASPHVGKELLKGELIESTRHFSETPFKNKLYESEGKIAMIMFGYNLDRDWLQKNIAGENEEQPADSEQENLPENVDLEEPVLLTKKVEQQAEEELPAEKDGIESSNAVRPDIDNFENKILEEEEVQLKDALSEKAVDVDPAYEKPIKEPGKLAVTKTFFVKIKNALSRGIKSIITSAGLFFAKIKNKLAKKPSRSEIGEQADDKAPVGGKEKKIDKANMKTYQYYLVKIKNWLVKFMRGIKQLVWDNWLGMGGNEMYLRGRAKKRRWGLLFVVIIIVIGVLYFSIQNQISEQERKARLEEAQRHLNAAIKIIDEVKEEADVLALLYGNDDRKQASLNKLAGAEAELVKAESVNDIYDQIQEQRDRMGVIKDKYGRIISADEIDRVLDLTGVFPNSSASDIVLAGGQLYILDQKGGKIFRASYSGNDLKEIATGLLNPRSITADKNGNLIVLDDATDSSIAIVNPESGTINRMGGLSSSRLAGVKQIEYVSNDKTNTERIYGIDTAQGKMLYMEKSASTYGLPQYKPEQYEEFKNSKDMIVVWPKVYILAPIKQGFYISYSDKDDTKPLTGLVGQENLYNATALYMDGNYLYIGEPAGKRVLVFIIGDSDYKLKAQYVVRKGDNFGNIKEVAADYNSRKLFVLDGTKVFVLDLNKLASY